MMLQTNSINTDLLEFSTFQRQTDAVDEIGRRLFEGLSAEAVYLFGSAARGDATLDSDLDFLVVVAESPLPRYRRAQVAHQLLACITVPKDVIVLTRDEWNRQLKVAASLPSTVVREGRLLYGS